TREQERQELAMLMDRFLASGGTIAQLDITARKPEPKGNLRDRPRTIVRARSCTRRELERHDRALAARARILVSAGLPGDRIRKKLGLGPVAFEQFIARHGICLSVQRRKA